MVRLIRFVAWKTSRTEPLAGCGYFAARPRARDPGKQIRILPSMPRRCHKNSAFPEERYCSIELKRSGCRGSARDSWNYLTPSRLLHEKASITPHVDSWDLLSERTGSTLRYVCESSCHVPRLGLACCVVTFCNELWPKESNMKCVEEFSEGFLGR